MGRFREMSAKVQKKIRFLCLLELVKRPSRKNLDRGEQLVHRIRHHLLSRGILRQGGMVPSRKSMKVDVILDERNYKAWSVVVALRLGKVAL
ncbi:hypothetical protein KSP39_PZI001870 [Platanthera zijinensis]|uniref:Uncharacterized protein n=1 Tax=Platanthera zijinensis TaxID=2320716 RepID=A0AAP0BYK0_9ASPA